MSCSKTVLEAVPDAMFRSFFFLLFIHQTLLLDLNDCEGLFGDLGPLEMKRHLMHSRLRR